MAAANLTVRLATAAVAVPLLLALLFLAPAWAWLLFILLVGVVAALELAAMTHGGARAAAAAYAVSIDVAVLAIWFFPRWPVLLLVVALLLPFSSIALTLWRLGDMSSAALRAAASTFGTMWVGAGLGAIALLRARGGDDGAAFVVLSMVLAWIADTGGYFAGRAFGKHKLYERVSPKKTVEGAIGGVAAAVVGALVARLLILPSVPIRDMVVLGVVGAVVGILGDLGESLLKRSVGVKDSGGIVPGHGGILDRIDALLITAPVTLLYVMWAR
jgi:phosphatidate cytidylyltransferase